MMRKLGNGLVGSHEEARIHGRDAATFVAVKPPHWVLKMQSHSKLLTWYLGYLAKVEAAERAERRTEHPVASSSSFARKGYTSFAMLQEA
jgi:hypothetical protein